MTLLYNLDLLGTAAFAASGALAGIRRDMDLFGVLVLGMVTATGGGTLRDLLHLTPLSPPWTLILSALSVIVLRLCAIHYNWSLLKANRHANS